MSYLVTVALNDGRSVVLRFASYTSASRSAERHMRLRKVTSATLEVEHVS